MKIKNYFQTFVIPAKVFRQLLMEENQLRTAFVLILIPLVLYTIIYILLAASGGGVNSFEPWLNISKEKYYTINQFLLAPSLLLCWIAATGFMQIMAKLAGGNGTFEQTLVVVSLGISIAMWGGIVHDLTESILCATGVIDAKKYEIAMNSPGMARTLLWICYSIYIILFLILFSMAVRIVHGLNKIKSIAIGVFSFVIFQTLFLVFNR